MKLGKIELLKIIPVRESLFVVGKRIFRLEETIFFSIFQRLLPVFFRPVQKYFLMKSFIPAGGNGFSC